MILGGLAAVVVITTAVLVTKKLTGRKQVNPADVKVPEYVKVDLLTPNKYSRPQTPLEKRDCGPLRCESLQHRAGEPELF